jgi:squalene-associated FAD-dependent desaturase
MPPANPNIDFDVLVIGAGLAGLSCAVRLTDQGLRVGVLERSDVAGGRARSWADPGTGDTVDIGPHVLLNKYANMLSLLERLGTRQHIQWETRKLLTVLDKGRRIPIQQWRLPPPFHGARNLLRMLPSVPFRVMASNLRVAWDAMTRTEAEMLALDGIPARSHLEAMGVHRDFIDWFWASASMALLNVPVEQCSAAALMRVFAQMIGHNDAAFGFPTVGLSELYVPQATGIIEQGGGRVMLGCGAAQLQWRDGRVTGVRTIRGSLLRARSCVLATPPSAAASLLPGEAPARMAAARMQPSPYVSTYLWFDRRITHERFWARPWSPEEFNTDFYDLTNIRSGAPLTGNDAAGSVIAANLIWSHRAHGMSDDEIVAVTLRELADFTPVAAQACLVSASVHRIPMSVPCPYPGTERQRPDTMGVPGLYLAGDWTRTGLPCCMEGATRSGALAAEAVLAAAGVQARIACPVPETNGLAGLLRRFWPRRALREGSARARSGHTTAA